jgi:signal transduction histidine kinase/CheY-like chemotaxis protein/HPt (histidine-containing phosphotransfer) domain-containing protein
LALLREQRYRRHFLRDDGKQNAIVMAGVCFAYTVAARNDFVLISDTALLIAALASRAFLVVVTAIVLVLLRRARWPRQQDRANHLALFAMMVVVLGANLTRIPSGKIQGSVIGAITLLGVVYFAQRGPLVARVALAGVVAVTAIVLAWHPHAAIEPTARLATTLGLVALSFIGVFSARGFEEQRRKRFDAERHERQARHELAVRLRELAVEKDRAEAMSRARTAFLAAMSHEFRTPMNAVIGLSDMLLDMPLGGEQRDHVGVISESARALLGLLNDILDFAKIDAQKLTLSPASFSVHKLATSVFDMLRPAATARGLALALEVSPDVPECLFGDDVRLRQVLVNLVCNAVKFTERGAVTLRIMAGAGGDHAVAFRVEDTGLGMTPQVLARLFRPFEQADGGITRSHGGTGLGLAISKQIVAAMGGDLVVESEPGRGSVFSFALALPSASAPEATTTTALPSRGERHPLVILVVDDNAINRTVARAKLTRLGYAVDFAMGGAQAVEAVANRTYDLVFMDLQMPGMSGIEATARISERLRGQRAPHIVAMTASVYEEDREACMKAGMRDFVGKPIDLAQLDAVLSRVAEERGAAVPLAPPALPSATLSAGMLSKLRQIETFGRPEFVAKLARRFLADTRERLPRMVAALGRGDAKEIAREAHILTSSSATLGATEMSELCARIEGAARRGVIDEIGEGVAALSMKFVEVERALTREMQEVAS